MIIYFVFVPFLYHITHGIPSSISLSLPLPLSLSMYLFGNKEGEAGNLWDNEGKRQQRNGVMAWSRGAYDTRHEDKKVRAEAGGRCIVVRLWPDLCVAVTTGNKALLCIHQRRGRRTVRQLKNTLVKLKKTLYLFIIVTTTSSNNIY